VLLRCHNVDLVAEVGVVEVVFPTESTDYHIFSMLRLTFTYLSLNRI